MTSIKDQPKPTSNSRPAVWDLVINDMQERDALGRHRYGTPLQPFNGRDALVDAYQEALDLAVYLRQAIAERDDQQAVERTTCERCGKTVGQNDWDIHTCTPLAEQPAQRKPLTVEQIIKCWGQVRGIRHGYVAFARAIEAAHGIKENT